LANILSIDRSSQESSDFSHGECQVGDKEHSTLINQEVLNEYVDEYGMSFEQAKTLGIDVERIRREHNFDANYEHIEAIESIEIVKE
jgi:hypothetical protein